MKSDLRSINDFLDQQVRQITDELGAQAVEETASMLELNLKKLAPKRDGDLLKSISRKKIRSTLQLVKVSAPHAHLVEYGHVASGWYKKQAGSQHVPPHPFVAPAVAATRTALGFKG